MVQNTQVLFKKIPSGYPVPGETLKRAQVDFDLDADLPSDSILTKTKVLSLDPYMRGKMRPSDKTSYTSAFELNEPIFNFGVSTVLKSNNPNFKKDDKVYGITKFAEYNIFNEEETKMLKVLENKENLPWTTWVGAAGMPGQTAWAGLKEIGKPQKGETIFVSGASGAVGQMVIALAHQAGCKVIASAGSDEKVEYLKSQLKVEKAFNYKTTDTREFLSKEKYELYWDNVGGETLETVYETIQTHGRIIACGAIADYNGTPYGIKNSFQIVAKQLKVQGFILGSMSLDGFYDEVPPALASGKFAKPMEHKIQGLDDGESFLDLMKGGNMGKAVIVLDDE